MGLPGHSLWKVKTQGPSNQPTFPSLHKSRLLPFHETQITSKWSERLMGKVFPLLAGCFLLLRPDHGTKES